MAGAAVLLSACGGGGGGGPDPAPPSPVPAVTSITAGVPKYGQALVFTVNGTALDASLTVAASACGSLQRSTTAPNVSTATQAFYVCAVSGVGDSTFSVTDAARATTLRTLAFNVPLPQVTLAISDGGSVQGSLVFTLEPGKVKATVDNFLQYVNDGFYAGTIFHRVVPGFVVQGGGFLPLGSGTPQQKATRAAIPLEVGRGLSNTANTLAMARTSVADSATSQFFVNLVDNSASLDPSSASAGYAVFGALASGQSVLSALVAAPCAPVSGLSECAPRTNVVITSATQTR